MKRTNLLSRALSVLIALVMIAGTAAFIPVSAASAVKTVEVDDVTVIRYTGGDWYTTTVGDDPTEYRWFHYDAEALNVKVTFQDGSSYEGSPEGLDAYGLDVSYANDAQHYNDPWDVGKHTIEITVDGVTANYDFIIEETPVSSIEVGEMSFCVGSHGWTLTSGSQSIWEYDTDPEYMKVTLKNGTVYEGNKWDVESESGYDVFIEDGQDVDTPWDIGKHTATLYFMGFELEFEVEITESPVKSVSVEDMTVVEGTNGYISTTYTVIDGNLVQIKQFVYKINPEKITVTLKDGTVITGDSYTVSEILDEYVYIDDPQDNGGILEAGHTYDVKLSVLGAETTFKFTVTPSPVKSISAEPVEVIEGTKGYVWTTNEVAWYHYNTGEFGNKFRIEMNDGTVYEGTAYEISKQSGEDINFTDDQDVNTAWGIGKHTAEFSFMGKKGSFEVTITETPVKSVTVEPITLIEGTDGSFWESYEEGGKLTARYFHYDVEPEKITIEFKDGTKISGDSSHIWQETGESVAIDDDQSDENPWGIGDHTASATFMTVKAEFTVTVEQSPIASISVDDAPLTIAPFTGGKYRSYWDYDEIIDFAWYCYDPQPAKYTVTEKGGASFTGTKKQIQDKYEAYISINTDQSYGSQWEAGGTYDAEVYFMGCSDSFKVTIGENPVKSVTAENASVTEYTDGFYGSYYDGAHNQYMPHSWYHYSLFPSKVTVEFKDGTSFTGTVKELEEKYNSSFVVTKDEQTYYASYGVGTYDVEGKFMDVPVSYKYTVTKGSDEPVTVTKVEFHDVTVPEFDRTFTDDGKTVYLYYPKFTVYFSDGTSVESQDGGAGVNRVFVESEYDDGQLKEPWIVGSSHVVKIKFEGIEGEFTVTIVKDGETSAMLGDVDGNGKLNAKDVTAIMKYLVGSAPKNFNEAAADYDGNGKINAKDVTKLMKYLVGAK